MHLRLLALSALVIANLSVAATPIDFKKVNSVLKTIADTAVQLKQVKDKDGKDKIEKLTAIFDEKTDIATARIGFSAEVQVHSAAWAKGTKSALAFNVQSKMDKDKDGEDLLKLKVGIGLSTDALALIRYAANHVDKDNHPCAEDAPAVGSTKIEEEFNKEACVHYRKFLTVKSVEEFSTAIKAILSARLKYIADTTAVEDKAGNTVVVKELAQEKTYIDAAFKSLSASKDPAVLKGSIVTSIGVVGGTTFEAIDYELSAKKFAVAVDIHSPQAAGFYSLTKSEIERIAEIATRKDDDKEKMELIAEFQDELAGFIDFAKTVLFEAEEE